MQMCYVTRHDQLAQSAITDKSAIPFQTYVRRPERKVHPIEEGNRRRAETDCLFPARACMRKDRDVMAKSRLSSSQTCDNCWWSAFSRIHGIDDVRNPQAVSPACTFLLPESASPITRSRTRLAGLPR